MISSQDSNQNEVKSLKANSTVENNPLLINTSAANQALQQTPKSAHAMNSRWQFWYHNRALPEDEQQQQETDKPQKRERSKSAGRNMKNTEYRNQLKSLGKIPTIEHFFNYYVFLKKPSDMPRDIDLYFFRENHMPMWEDSPYGGLWIVKLHRDDNIDKMWESMLFALVGEQFEEPTVIGTGLSLRHKETLMQVWLQDGRNIKTRTNISNKIRHFLGLDPQNVTLFYKEHHKSIKDGSTMKNAEGFKFIQPQTQPPKVDLHRHHQSQQFETRQPPSQYYQHPHHFQQRERPEMYAGMGQRAMINQMNKQRSHQERRPRSREFY